MQLTISLLQLLPETNKQRLLAKSDHYCELAKNHGADIALFPEMWSNGYSIKGTEEELRKQALSLHSSYIGHFQKLAHALDLAIAITFLEKHNPQPQNSVVLIDRHGRIVLHYSKIHTCDFGDEAKLDPGDNFHVCEIDCAAGTVKVGSMICYDREFPESARILMLQGSEVILIPNACPMEINRLSQLRTRAYENMCAIATCNYPAGNINCNGHSTIFDGVAYPQKPDDHSYTRDMKILESDEREGIYTAAIDLSQLRRYRCSEVQGNAYRRPEKYHLLIDQTIRPPFVRSDRRA